MIIFNKGFQFLIKLKSIIFESNWLQMSFSAYAFPENQTRDLGIARSSIVCMKDFFFLSMH